MDLRSKVVHLGNDFEIITLVHEYKMYTKDMKLYDIY